MIRKSSSRWRRRSKGKNTSGARRSALPKRTSEAPVPMGGGVQNIPSEEERELMHMVFDRLYGTGKVYVRKDMDITNTRYGRDLQEGVDYYKRDVDFYEKRLQKAREEGNEEDIEEYKTRIEEVKEDLMEEQKKLSHFKDRYAGKWVVAIETEDQEYEKGLEKYGGRYALNDPISSDTTIDEIMRDFDEEFIEEWYDLDPRVFFIPDGYQPEGEWYDLHEEGLVENDGRLKEQYTGKDLSSNNRVWQDREYVVLHNTRPEKFDGIIETGELLFPSFSVTDQPLDFGGTFPITLVMGLDPLDGRFRDSPEWRLYEHDAYTHQIDSDRVSSHMNSLSNKLEGVIRGSDSSVGAVEGKKTREIDNENELRRRIEKVKRGEGDNIRHPSTDPDFDPNHKGVSLYPELKIWSRVPTDTVEVYLVHESMRDRYGNLDNVVFIGGEDSEEFRLNKKKYLDTIRDIED